MTLPVQTASSLLVVLALAVALSDLRYRRIPNLLVFPAMMAGILVRLLTPAPPNWQGALDSLMGIVVGFILLLLPYAVGGMMAGDVKFLMAIGALVGWRGAAGTLLAALIFYPVMAVIAVVREGKVRLTWLRFRRVFWNFVGHFLPGAGIYALRLEAGDDPRQRSVTTPFGVALAVGSLLVEFTSLFDALIGRIGE